jgi:hypothetical protein
MTTASCCSSAAARGLQRFFMAGRYPTHDDFIALLDGLGTASDSHAMTADDIRSTVPSIASGKLRVMLAALKHDGLVGECRGTALCHTHVLLEAVGETVESSECVTCDNGSGLSIRSEAVAIGAA